MECWILSNRKSWLCWSLMSIIMVRQTQSDCIEEERKGLLEIKASLINSYNSSMDHILPTWVDYGDSDCCDWERVNCNTTSTHIIELSLNEVRGMIYNDTTLDQSKSWPLNISLFLHFKELRSLSLSYDFLDKEIMKTGLEKLSSLKKLEVLDLNSNFDFDNDILRSLRTLTSLKILDLSYTNLNENFPTNELSYLTNLEELNLRYTRLSGTPNIVGCESLSRLKRLDTIYLTGSNFNKSIISCLSALPSLKILDLSYCSLGGSFPVQEFLNLPDLEVLLLTGNDFNGTLPLEALASFHHLEVIDLSANNFVGRVPSAIQKISALRVVSFANNKLIGSLDHGWCELKNLHELDLSVNMFHGTVPPCLYNLSSLKLLDISLNRFSGILVSSLIANLTSLEYIDFSHNTFEGSFSLSSFSNHSKLEVIRFSSDNDKLWVETEEPIDWFPLFQLEILVLSNCNLKMPKGRVIPGFLLHQHKLQHVDLSRNSLEGHFPNWLIKNNTNLDSLFLRNNLFGGLPLYRNANMKWLDMSGNHMKGIIPEELPTFFPNMFWLNLSMNTLSGHIPSSIAEFSKLLMLDLSDNELSGEVPKGLFTNLSQLFMLKLSNNKLHGQILSGNLTWGNIRGVYLDNNRFTGKIGINSNKALSYLRSLDISNNLFTGMIPDWISNMSRLSELVVRKNSFKGRFPCGPPLLSFLDISQNSFSGPIPFCLNFQNMKHLHLGSNRFTGSIPNFFRNFTNLLTLDIGNNGLSGMIPKFIGELSNLRILLLRKNNFSGSIPKKLCQLSNVSLIDLSGNSLSGSIPSCLQNITGPSDLAFIRSVIYGVYATSSYRYGGTLQWDNMIHLDMGALTKQDEIQFTTKELFLSYKGDILNYMAGLDLSCNKLTGQIPQELAFLSHIRALNLSHNHLTGPIPVSFSNLSKIESLDLSSNGLTSKVPSELIQLTSLSIFNVSYNNLSGKLPEMKAQFGTFTEASYKGNPLLCGPPLEKKCTTTSQLPNAAAEEDNEKWFNIDMTSFYVSSSSTCLVLLFGFAALLYINPYWRRRWLRWVEDCMFTCYYFLYDVVTKPSTIVVRK